MQKLIPISQELIDDGVLFQDLFTAVESEIVYNMMIVMEKSLGIVDGMVWEYDKHNNTALRIQLEKTAQDLGYDYIADN